MPDLSIIQLILSPIFLFALLIAIISQVNEYVSRLLDLRAKDLEGSIRQMLGDVDLAKKVWDHRLVKGLAGKVGGRPSSVPAHTFALALFDCIAPASENPSSLHDIRTKALALPEPSAKQALLSIIDAANGDMDRARTGIEDWFNATMDSVSGIYKRQMQRLSLLISLGIAITSGADAIALANTISLSSTISEIAKDVAKATPSAGIMTTTPVQEALRLLNSLVPPIGWGNLPTDFVGWAQKILGLSITAFALSIGASLWYDLLKNIPSRRSGVSGGKQN